MRRLTTTITATVRTLGNECGQDLLEYALLAALISVFAAGAVTSLGSQINNVLWQTIANNF
jgi:Flp pilus assembly pilin Flp